MYKLGLYLRVSTEEQAQVVEGSIKSQEHRLKDFIKFKNSSEPWGKVIKIYSDEGISAKNTNRPAFKKMMNDIKSGKINLILATDLSRLSRNIMDFCIFLESLKKSNASFLSLKEQFDTSTPMGEMMVFNMINLAQFERKQTSERVSLNFNARAQRGLLNGGPAILGYDKDPENSGKYIINKTEATSVVKIFQAYLQQGSLAKACKKLNVDALIKPKHRLTKNGRLISHDKWTTDSLRTILNNKAYIGLREINKLKKDKDQSNLKPHQKYQVVKAQWPSIVDDKLFNMVQKELENARTKERSRLKNSTKRSYLLTGLIECPDCKQNLIGRTAHGRSNIHRYYGHLNTKGLKTPCKTKNLRADEVEEAIILRLGQIYKDQGLLEKLEGKVLGQTKNILKDFEKEKVKLSKSIVDCEAQIEATFKLESAGDDLSVVSLIKERLKKLSKQKELLQNQLQETKTQHEALKTTKESESLKERILRFKKLFKKASDFQKKKLIHAVIEKITLKDNKLHIFYKNSCARIESLKNGDDEKIVVGSTVVENGRGGWTRTNDPSVMSGML